MTTWIRWGVLTKEYYITQVSVVLCAQDLAEGGGDDLSLTADEDPKDPDAAWLVLNIPLAVYQ